MQQHYPVLILGDGIAGLLLAGLLRQQGIGALLLRRKQTRKAPALAETLPPSALPLLQSMGVLDHFEACSQRTHGYHAMWGSDRIATHNFFFSTPFQYGLKLDKAAVVQRLSDRVGSSCLVFDCLLRAEASAPLPRITVLIDGAATTLHAQVLVDATGRSRALLKRLDIGQKAYDTTVATTCYLPRIDHPRLTHRVYTESFEHGWGIVSALDTTTNVMTVYTHRDATLLRVLKEPARWPAALADTHLLRDFVPTTFTGKITGAQANSSKADRVAGPHWLAVGDAAMAYDPLSSHGITNAVYGASTAAQAIARFLGGDPSAFAAYDTTLRRIFAEYLRQRQRLYAAERRWVTPFWRQP